MNGFLTPEDGIALVTLTFLEIVLGIDNVIFISILSGKLPPEQRAAGRRTGLALAMLTRIALLMTMGWVTRMTTPLAVVLGIEISIRNIIMVAGGLFLIAKATFEIHHKIEDAASSEPAPGPAASFAAVIVQILILDVVFSLDSVITAVGMAQNLTIMIAAVMLSVVFMMAFSGAISGFVERHPTVKILALSFLLLIGMALVADGFDQHIRKGYIYFAMGFSMFVEFLNLRVRGAAARPATAPIEPTGR